MSKKLCRALATAKFKHLHGQIYVSFAAPLMICTPCSVRRRFLSTIIVICLLTVTFLVFKSDQPKPVINEPEISRIFELAKNQSLCSPRAARRGFDQHVLSVSAYESTDRVQLVTSLTWNYIQIFAKEAKHFYPTWIVRVYFYNLRNKTIEDLNALETQYDNLDFCNVEMLPVLGNLKDRLPGKMQRFLPSMDPLVSAFVVRDLDSEIFDREVQAVNEWIFRTVYAFHIMRDNPAHSIPMLGGLWGMASDRLSISDRFIAAKALLPPTNPEDLKIFLQKYSNTGDQKFLEDHFWPIARRNSITHDSFTCRWSRYIYRTDTRPFPTRREHPSCFVGCPKPCCTSKTKNISNSRFPHCPLACRPTKHPDWIFC